VALWVREPGEVAVEVVGRHGVVLVGHDGHGRRRHGHAAVVVAAAHDAGVADEAPRDEHGDLRVRLRRLVGERDHVVVRRRRVGGHQHVDGLPRRDGDHVRLERRQVVAVGADHRERVPGHLEVVLGEERRVDDPQQVGLAALHVEDEALLGHAGAVAEVAELPVDGGRQRVVVEVTVGHPPVELHEVELPPLADDDGHVLGRRRRRAAERVVRPVLGADDEGAIDGGAEAGDVRVPPQGADLAGEVEAVGVVGAGRDGALGDEAGAVGPAAPELPHAVPVDGQAVVQPVHDVDHHRVAVGDVDLRAGELAVHHVDLGRVAQVGHVHLVDLYV